MYNIKFSLFLFSNAHIVYSRMEYNSLKVLKFYKINCNIEFLYRDCLFVQEFISYGQLSLCQPTSYHAVFIHGFQQLLCFF